MLNKYRIKIVPDGFEVVSPANEWLGWCDFGEGLGVAVNMLERHLASRRAWRLKGLELDPYESSDPIDYGNAAIKEYLNGHK